MPFYNLHISHVFGSKYWKRNSASLALCAAYRGVPTNISLDTNLGCFCVFVPVEFVYLSCWVFVIWSSWPIHSNKDFSRYQAPMGTITCPPAFANHYFSDIITLPLAKHYFLLWKTPPAFIPFQPNCNPCQPILKHSIPPINSINYKKKWHSYSKVFLEDNAFPHLQI